MKNSDINDPQFRQAVEAIGSGNFDELKNLVTNHPRLVKDRLRPMGDGYFKDPYLLWFVAENPIREGKLAPNIIEVTNWLVQAVKRESPESYHEQINYTLGLVASGRIARECGVQIAMMDLLIDAGAVPGDGMEALAHGNIVAARHLIARGGELTLPTAVCLERRDEIISLTAMASADEKLTALTSAAYYGKSEMINLLLTMGADPNGYPESNSSFHSHATPLHQAVSSGCFDAVKLLVEAGAKLEVRDKVYNGTPVEWSEYMHNDEGKDETAKKNFARIAAF